MPEGRRDPAVHDGPLAAQSARLQTIWVATGENIGIGNGHAHAATIIAVFGELWQVTPDEDRPDWPLEPLTGVGPLRFSMTPGEVAKTLDESATVSRFGRDRDGDAVRALDRFDGVGVTAYYDRAESVVGVAVDALKGPQVHVQGIRLVARVPSELNQEMTDHATRHGFALRYTHEGNPAIPTLGVVIRVQRAGDVVLTRPLLGVSAWAENPWDAVSQAEWTVFLPDRTR